MAHRSLGVIKLDTRFPRPPGDIGCAQTFLRAGIPVQYLSVQGATPERVVRQADAALLAPFIDAAKRLASDGATLISTTCGFLAAHQAALSRAVDVPVITSSLLACAALQATLKDVGIVTIDAGSLTSAVLEGAQVPAGTPIEGVSEGCEFQRRILGNESSLDTEQARMDVVAAAVRLKARHPSLRGLVLECTNMPPYRDAVVQATGCEVHDLETMLLATWRGLGIRQI
jgi:hypothetical protein